jgi:hypothetical protein
MLSFILIYIGLLIVSFLKASREEMTPKRRAPKIKELPPEEEPNNTENFNCVTWCGRTGETLKEEHV